MKIKTYFVAAAVALSPVAASAAPINLTYQGPSTTNEKQVEITAAPTLSPSIDTGDANAFGFEMTSGQPDPLDDFLAWCLDLQYNLGPQGTAQPYETTMTPFGNTLDLSMGGRADRIQSVFDANYGSVDAADGDQAAGFQLALWEALYDDGFDLTDGDFKAADKDTSTTTAFDLAQTYLGNADGYGSGKKFSLIFLESNPGDEQVQRQALVTATPVPLPAAGVLLLGALGGLGGASALRRRRKAA